MESERPLPSLRATSTSDIPATGAGLRKSTHPILDDAAQVLRRVLVVDDNPDIHDDFRKVLGSESASVALAEAEAALLELEPEAVKIANYDIDWAAQGLEAVALVDQMAQQRACYAVAFIDIRMPPGIDGVETARRMWAIDPGLQVVFCTAYSDYSWESMIRKLGRNHRFLVLKKPFDTIEVRQVALALSEKRRLFLENELTLRTLEERVKQRTVQLERAHAKIQKEMLERLLLEKGLRQTQKLEALGRLAAGIGHEINNPLSYIINGLEFLEHQLQSFGNRLDAAERDSFAGAVQDALLGAQRIKQTVRGTRLFSSTNESQPTEANVVACMQAALAMVRSELRHKARLVVHLVDVPSVVGDSPRLEQTFVNLLLNAIQAMPKRQTDEAEIHVSTERVDDDWVEVKIRDNGCGIAGDDMAQIFDPFFSAKPPGEGTGLGLWVSKNVIESFGGKISVESSLGSGTLVRLRVPIAGRALSH